MTNENEKPVDVPAPPKRARSNVLTVEEAAAELGVSPAVVYAAVKGGYIPKLPLPGRLIRISRAKFDEYKRGELQRELQPTPVRRLTAHQEKLLAGVKSII